MIALQTTRPNERCENSCTRGCPTCQLRLRRPMSVRGDVCGTSEERDRSQHRAGMQFGTRFCCRIVSACPHVNGMTDP